MWKDVNKITTYSHVIHIGVCQDLGLEMSYSHNSQGTTTTTTYKKNKIKKRGVKNENYCY